MVLEREREPEPGEVCSCGRPAVLVYITERFGDVPWCGEYEEQDDTATEVS